MTSGQGGPSGPPPGQPPYGYGYGPAPAARPGPPQPAERPLQVRAGLGAFIAWIVLGLASFVFVAAHWDEFSEEVLVQPGFREDELAEAGIEPAAFLDTLGALFLVFGVLYTALLLMFVWFAWRGYGWARIVLFVLGGLSLVLGLGGLGSGSSPFPFLTGLGFFQFLVVATGVVLLAGRPATEWFRSEKERRALGGRR
jgi:hypothetical protein